MKKLLLTVAFLATCQPAFPNEPEPPTEEPEPEPPTEELEPETPYHSDSDSDRDPVVSTPTFYPCCVKDGEVVVMYRDLFSSKERTLRRCQKAIERDNALIHECPGQVSPEAVK